MYKDKTVFVVGAGASAELDLPVGSILAERISKLMRFEFDNLWGKPQVADEIILRAWQVHFENVPQRLNKHLEAARRISDGVLLAQSIDNFLDIHAEDKEAIFCGKSAIARAIIEAERKSKLYYDKSSNPRMIDFSKVTSTWLTPFFSKLIYGRKKSDVENIFDGITIICFNYDRCIEYYLLHSLQQAYAINPNEAAALLSKLKIYHPYGTVGSLPALGATKSIDYGDEIRGNQLIGAAEGIQTYTEQIEDEESLAEMKQAVMLARSLVFLGFAYHQQNMELLTPDRPSHVKQIFGTAYQMSNHGVSEIRNRLTAFASDNSVAIEIKNDLKCAALLDHYQISL